jgi:hypothetical protein
MTFYLNVESEIIEVRKIQKEEFSDIHKSIISQIEFIDGKLILPDEQWKSIYLGSGEEKAVFGIIDNLSRMFALELIDEKHYLNGRFVGGEYYYQTRVNGISNKKFKPESLLKLNFSGLVKVREYV